MHHVVGRFSALHGMPAQTSGERCLSVRPSVCPSVKRVNCDKKEEKSVQIFIPYERSFILVFGEERLVGGGDPLYQKFWVNRAPLERNLQF